MPDSMADRFFSAELGLGLSLLRIQVKPEGVSFELDTARLAVERGAKIWAAPWSPPAEWKTNGETIMGGSLFEDRYDDWAASLADFAQHMDSEGLPLLAISAQNEPDYSAEWDTCLWSPDELATFVGEHLGPALRERGLDTPVLAPESANWGSFASYTDAILQHQTAGDFVQAVATHSYGGSAFAYDRAREHGKEIWQTEVSDPGSAEDPEIDSALRVARLIHDHLTIANTNAWHYWWLIPNIYPDAPETTGALVNQSYQLTRRAYALGNFSKFIRPGFRRVDTTDTRKSGTFASAYVDPQSDRVAIVVINERRTRVNQAIELRGGRLGKLATWVTSERATLEQGAPLQADGDLLAVPIEARSIVTLVGELLASDAPDAG
jgi:glucuronoarabinoxylan endo-1,4-beta-xylanase